jgi:ABC-type multidrug transport system fused ATPase/permease subunit
MPAGSELRLEDVELVYSDGTNPLRGLSGSFPPHCRVAIQGSSGAGKTTLAQLLVRFLDPTRGRVLLDGVDVRELPLHELRARVALAEQDAHVFTTTIRENLLLANHDAGEQRLWAVLRAVRLEEWVRSLPDGLDTLVGEDGDLLSGGQRQRLTIARALLTDAPVVILDEPTAQVDASTSTQLIRSVIEVIGDRSLIMISHRSEGLGEFDTVLTLRDGSFASA